MSHGVFILEDHPATSKQLVKAVEDDPRLHAAGMAQDLEAAFAWIAAHPPPVAALVDLALPDGDGAAFIEYLHTHHPQTEPIVMTVFGDESHVVRAIEAGATGYLLKDQPGTKLTDIIVDIINGGSFISPSIARLVLRRMTRESPNGPQTEPEVHLTNRESEILRMAVKGFSYGEIADTLGVSYNTVTSHVQHIYRKLSVSSRGEAVFEAVQLGLVSFNPDSR